MVSQISLILVTILDDVIDSLTYEDPDDKIFYPVKKGDKMLLRCFLAYHQSLESDYGDVDYNAITQANFDSYRISPAYRATLYQPDPILSSSSSYIQLCLRLTSHPSALFTSCYVSSHHQERSFTLSDFEG